MSAHVTVDLLGNTVRSTLMSVRVSTVVEMVSTFTELILLTVQLCGCTVWTRLQV